MLKERQVQKIRYTKVNDNSGSMDRFEVTERTIIPTFIPKTNVKALDVTDLATEQQDEMAEALKAYNKYVVDRSKVIAKFEVWYEQTNGKSPPEIKWRTFKTDNTEVL